MKRPSAASRVEDTRSRYDRLAVSLGRTSFVTKRGIDALLRNVRDEGMPTAFSRRSQYRARKHVCNTNTLYGPLVESEKFNAGGKHEFDLGYQNPQAWLYYQCKRSQHFAALVVNAINTYSCSAEHPWQIVLYQDGVNPSDGLSVNQSRTSHVFYWSFLEFGPSALAHEEVWGTITMLRKCDAIHVDYGLCQIVDRVLNRFFKDPHNFRKAGVEIELHDSGETHWIYAKLGMILCDEPAIKEILGCKGHSGTKCCFKCLNAVLHRGFQDQDPWWVGSLYFVSIAETDFNKFKTHPPNQESLRNLIKRLHASKLTETPDDFENRSQSYGWNYNPYSISLNVHVDDDVDDITVFDWAHCYLIDGLLDVEFGLAMKWLHKNTQTRYAELWEYMQSFRLPKCRGSLEHLFTEEANAKHIKNENFNCTASELLTMSPMVKRYCEKVLLPREGPLPIIVSLVAVLVVVEMLQGIKCFATDPDDLARAIKRHLDLFVAAYGMDYIRPKHHYVLHLPSSLRKFGFILSTFTHERKHRMIRRYTQQRKVLKSWSVSVIEEVTCHSIWEMSHRFYNVFDTSVPSRQTLHNLHAMFPSVPDKDFSLHNGIYVHMGQAYVGDVVSFLYNGSLHIGELLITIGIAADSSDFGGDIFSFVSLWEHAPRACDDETGRTFLVKDNPKLVKVTDLDAVYIHRPANDGTSSFVLIPRERHHEFHP